MTRQTPFIKCVVPGGIVLLAVVCATAARKNPGNCSGCHSSANKTGSGAQAPLYADVDVNLAYGNGLESPRIAMRFPSMGWLCHRLSKLKS
jgi:hypothetical protein